MDAFLHAEDVDRVFHEVLEWKPKGIILDVRAAPGVTLAALRTLSWIMPEPVDAGVWFGPRQRAEALKGNFDAIPRAEITSASSVEAAEAILDTQGAVHLTVQPEANRFTGPVAVLTSRRSSASVEPLVWAIKNSKRAQTYGQATAGKPLLSRPIDIGKNWILWLAAADYRTPTNEKLTDRGIKPNFEFSNRDAAQAAAEKQLLKDAGTDSAAATTESPLRHTAGTSPYPAAANRP
jgi:C-terminal processing protease CtpA/Prc